MNKTLEFYNWFTSIGGFISNECLERVQEKLNKKPQANAISFRKKSSETKKKYNHQFVLKDRS
jgi:hypothetical protein